jgi:putative FmdB family regulatory protein
MPIYQYQCEACHRELEVLQKVSDEPLRDCPECGEPSLKKKVTAAAFRLKGGGWYETDFKTGDKKNLAGSSDAAPASGGGQPSAGSADKSAGSADKPAPAKPAAGDSKTTA